VVVALGDISRWPNINEEWDLAVLPPARPIHAAALSLSGNEPPAENQTLTISLGSLPKGHVDGTVAWDLPEKPKLLELRLLWYTSGRGTMDVGVVGRQRIDNAGTHGIQAFHLTLPHAPRPFAGKLVAITWALELVAEPGGQAVRLDLPLTDGKSG
jgi:hypothetical protein